jgi:hypothetical protein
MITLGKGCIHGKSGTQRLNRKSSTEAEFVTIGDAANQVLWTRNFMLAQGYRRGPAKVYQDNMSTIQLIKNGRSNRERTHRHFDIRHFFLTDRVSSGDITISYMKTQDMVADILTKPLQGQQFKKLRSLLLNTSFFHSFLLHQHANILPPRPEYRRHQYSDTHTELHTPTTHINYQRCKTHIHERPEYSRHTK